ncbi:MAG: FKBP-type peptidyl-prolyl cis-trans isomerase [Candidatus Methanoperedens sp.]|nr:FKBP-type peptidyl-prolyl cis-trans isomerase [Candidatus Methanoperedens sp.]
MNKIFLLIMAAAILLSGCVDQTNKTVKSGDNISVDYIGSFEDGKVFDTSIESVAQANELPPRGVYEPLKFKVGQKPPAVIEGFDKGVIGMKKGETKILKILPEEAYPIDPSMIQVSPIIFDIPATMTIPKELDIPRVQFEEFYGENHSIGDTVLYPDSNINITIKNISSQVSVVRNLIKGSNVWILNSPWNQTVTKVDDKNITLKPNVTKNELIQLYGAPFSITVVDINATNITIRYNPIPDTTVELPGMFGQMVPTKISFNETSMIMDQNPEVAGKTLIFNVTLVSIDK